MPDTIEDVLGRLPDIRDATRDLKETLLANLVMTGEIPAPTFQEANRGQFLRDRFSECGLSSVSVDEVGNVMGIREGSDGDSARNVLLVAHLDTVFDARADHTIEVREDRVIGASVGDNALGVATLATLPSLLDMLGVEMRSNLMLMGSTRSLGRGDLEGMRFFLENTDRPIHSGVCVEGVQIGRLSYTSLGMVRGEITAEVPDAYDWTRFGASGAIRQLNDVMTAINRIPLPQTPRTSIVFGSIHGGTSFNTIATQAALRFEVRSDSSDEVRRVHERIAEIAEEQTAETGANVKLDIVAQREPGGVPFGHPLVKHTRAVMDRLDITPRVSPSTSELAVFIRRNVPAVTLGVSTGRNLHEAEESVEIEPMFTGLAQLVGVVIAIDEGLCDED
ncbi:MAG: M20/M25/M40 family metallo-hydrolase [Phycisphaera sp.]|nr:M20/M25/M40 family metallo-hydrolase [Phycisphaera sp.]